MHEIMNSAACIYGQFRLLMQFWAKGHLGDLSPESSHHSLWRPRSILEAKSSSEVKLLTSVCWIVNPLGGKTVWLYNELVQARDKKLRAGKLIAREVLALVNLEKEVVRGVSSTSCICCQDQRSPCHGFAQTPLLELIWQHEGVNASKQM